MIQLMAASDNSSDRIRTMLLEKVSRHGLEHLSIKELEQLSELLEKTNYQNSKAEKSRQKLVKKINAAIYNKYKNLD